MGSTSSQAEPKLAGGTGDVDVTTTSAISPLDSPCFQDGSSTGTDALHAWQTTSPEKRRTPLELRTALAHGGMHCSSTTLISISGITY